MKGDCYTNAFKFVEDHPDWTLVHGIPLGTGGEAEGLRFGHAWVEINGYVFDPTHGVITTAERYYLAGTIEFTVKYSYKKAMELASRSGHRGPWNKTIKQSKHKDG